MLTYPELPASRVFTKPVKFIVIGMHPEFPIAPYKPPFSMNPGRCKAMSEGTGILKSGRD